MSTSDIKAESQSDAGVTTADCTSSCQDNNTKKETQKTVASNSKGKPKLLSRREIFIIIPSIIAALAGIIQGVIVALASRKEPEIEEPASSNSDSSTEPEIGGGVEGPKKPGKEDNGHEMIFIRGNDFQMGSSAGEKGHHEDEEPQHPVRVKSFYLSKFPVTHEQYQNFLEANPMVAQPAFWDSERFNKNTQPVVGVSWNDAKKYCDWAGLRLPTEAEWEFACRAGTITRFYSGDEEKSLAEVGWYKKNSTGELQPVGLKNKNNFGLYDMHGNIHEWVEDDYHDNYVDAPSDGSAWIDEPERAGKRVFRSCARWNTAEQCRSAVRYGESPGLRYSNLGFRPAKSVDTQN